MYYLSREWRMHYNVLDDQFIVHRKISLRLRLGTHGVLLADSRSKKKSNHKEDRFHDSKCDVLYNKHMANRIQLTYYTYLYVAIRAEQANTQWFSGLKDVVIP